MLFRSDSGIGRSVAVAFAKEGADVAIVDLPGSDDLQETKSLVESQGRKCVAIQADLRTAEANREAVETAVEALGGLDIIVANAGFQMSHQDISEFPPEQLHRTFETNVFSPFWLVQAAKDHLGPGASVIITTSIQAYDPSEVLLDYAATKAAKIPVPEPRSRTRTGSTAGVNSPAACSATGAGVRNCSHCCFRSGERAAAASLRICAMDLLISTRLIDRKSVV